jgi:dTDP-4-dehydrorhamnose 3,5-epimerase-like enzyme
LQINLTLAKLVKCGEFILNVAIDLRKVSYLWTTFQLIGAENKKQLMVPHGFGFSILSEATLVFS